MRNISDLLTQLQGLGGDENGQVQVPHSSPETELEVNKTESERDKKSRETQAQQMFDRYDFTPFRREGVDMYESYKKGVQYMQSIFFNFFNLKQYNIDQRQWTSTNGKVYDNGLFYLLQKMGLQMVRSTAEGWHMEGAGNFDSRTSEDICVNWFKRLHESGLLIASHLHSLNKILKPQEKEVMHLIWTQIQNFMNLFHYHYQAPTNFVKQQAVWVYRED
jgi:hypothetical protein